MLEDFYFGPHEHDLDAAGSESVPLRLQGPTGAAPQPGSSVDFRVLTAPENVAAAWERVRRNRGCAGVDRQSISDLEPGFSAVWEKTARLIQSGTWTPRPLLRVAIPKCDGGTRLLGIPTVMDRVVAQAMAQLLTPVWEPRFSARSFGYRPGRSTQDALHQVRTALQSGHTTCLHLDIADFFDTIPHGPLLERLAAAFCGDDCVNLLARLLRAPVLECGSLFPTVAGVPQGSPVSPLLANIALDPLDHWLTARGVEFVRYADDILILTRTVSQAEALQFETARELSRLGLTLNLNKTRLGPPESTDFLGFTFWRDGSGTCRLAVSPSALDACRRHLRQLGPGPTVEHFLKSWQAYFRLSELPGDWESILAFAAKTCGVTGFTSRQGSRNGPQPRRTAVNYQGRPAGAAAPLPSRAPWWLRLRHLIGSSPLRVHLETSAPAHGWVPRLRGLHLRLWGHSVRFRF